MSPVLAELDRLIAESAPDTRPALVVELAARLARLGAGLAALAATSNAKPADEPERWITPEQAVELAGLPRGNDEKERSLKRLYSWAKGKPWASNPTGRFLRIHERRFRAWLATRR